MRLSENHYLLWLMNNPGINNIKAFELLNRFKTAENIFNTDLNEIKNVVDININAWSTYQNEQRIYNLVENIENIGMKYVTVLDSNYPVMLKDIYNAPVVLYYVGILPDNRLPCVSIIGTRKCTEYGTNAARVLARDLAKCGVTIVSGMAEGVDTSAHVGAPDSEGLTIAVLGGGANHCYPKENRYLMDRIIENGCCMSEYPPGTVPRRAYFPQRNRIISGLSHALIITEADKKSGTSITANCALEQGREVFAVPGSIFSRQSNGTNEMLKNGAYPITSCSDILFFLTHSGRIANKESIPESELGENTYEKPIVNLSDDEKLIYSHIKFEPVTIEELLGLTGLSVQNALVILTKLEFKGYIKRLPGQKCMRSI